MAQSMQSRIDSVSNHVKNSKLKTSKLDSIESKSFNFLDKKVSLDKIMQNDIQDDTAKVKNNTRSRSKYSPEAVQHKLDSVNALQSQNKKSTLSILDTATQKIDNTLNKINNPTQVLNHAVDSLK